MLTISVTDLSQAEARRWKFAPGIQDGMYFTRDFKAYLVYIGKELTHGNEIDLSIILVRISG